MDDSVIRTVARAVRASVRRADEAETDAFRPRLDLVVVPLALVLVVGRDYLTERGYVYLAEQFEVYTVSQFQHVLFPLWNAQYQSFSAAELQKLYLYQPLVSLAQVVDSYKLLQALLLLGPLFVGYLSAYVLTSGLLREQRPTGRIVALAAHVAGFLYVVNPWVVNSSRNVSLRFSHAFFPLLVYLYVRAVTSDDRRPVVSFALLLALVGTFRLNVLVGLTTGVILILYLAFESGARRAVWNTAVAYSLAALLSLGKFLPSVWYAVVADVGVAGDFSAESVRRASMAFVLSGVTNVQGYPGFTFVYTGPMLFLFALVTAFSLAYLLRRDGEHRFYRLVPVTVFVLAVLLNSVTVNVDGLVSSLPLSNYAGRLLRQSKWNAIPLVASVSVMSGFTVAQLLTTARKSSRAKRTLKTLLLVSCVLLVAAGSAWPLFTGDLDGYWNPSPPPEDYVGANQAMDGTNGSHAIWFPAFFGRSATWSDQRGETGVAAPVGAFPERSSSRPTYRPQSYFFNYYRPIPSGIQKVGHPTYQGDLAAVYRPLNLRHVVIHWDGRWVPVDGMSNARLATEADAFAARQRTNPVYDGSNLTAFELGNDTAEFRVVDSFTTVGGLETMGSVAAASSATVPALVFANDRPPGEEVEPTANLLVKGQQSRSLLTTNGTVLAPSEHVSDPGNEGDWQSSSVESTAFRHVLANRDVRWGWQFDHRKGVAFTDATQTVSPAARPGDDALVASALDENVSRWRAQNERLDVSREDGRLRARLPADGESWPALRSPPVSVESDQPYRFELDVRGRNATKSLVKIVELDGDGDVVAKNWVSDGWIRDGAGNFEKSLKVDYTATDESTEYLHLSVEQSILVDDPPAMSVSIDEFDVYAMGRFANPPSIRIPFSTDKAGEYRLFLRHLETGQGGTVNYSVDGTNHSVTTNGSSDRFVWTEVGTQRLDEGDHTLVLENVRGFNAVNLVSLVPEDEYERQQRRLDRRHRNGTVAHLFEAESDVRVGDGTVRSERNASNGRVVEIPASGTVNWTADAVTTGRYRLAVRGEGTVAIRSDDRVWRFNRSTPGYAYTAPFTLPAGANEFRMRVGGNESATLDAVWLYSAPANESVANRTIGDVLSADPPATVEHVERIGPTTYRLRVNASAPYTLSFAEGYDPLWTAEVGTPNGTERYDSTPLYSVINGFRIDETGTHTVTIRYRPQGWFRDSALVSGATFVLCLGLLYGERRGRPTERLAERVASWGGRLRETLGEQSDAFRRR